MHAKPDYGFFFADTPLVREVRPRAIVARALRAYRRQRRTFVIARMSNGFTVSRGSTVGVYVRSAR